MKNLKSKLKGFTIVELVIVMVVIGILSAVALPRMVNLAKEARKSAYLAVANNLVTSVELLRSQWTAMSEPDVVTTADGISFFMDHNLGFPLAVGNTRPNPFTLDGCINLWNALLKNPPLASQDAGCALNGTCKYELVVSYSSADANSADCDFIDKDGNEIAIYFYLDDTFVYSEITLYHYDWSLGHNTGPNTIVYEVSKNI